MKKLIKNEICGSVNSARMHCSQKRSKVTVTVHVPYMNSNCLWGENAWKKKKKRGNAETKRRRKSKHYLYMAQKMTTPSFRARLVDMFKN